MDTLTVNILQLLNDNPGKSIQEMISLLIFRKIEFGHTYFRQKIKQLEMEKKYVLSTFREPSGFSRTLNWFLTDLGKLVLIKQ